MASWLIRGRGGQAGAYGLGVALLGAVGGVGSAERFNRAVGDRVEDLASLG